MRLNFLGDIDEVQRGIQLLSEQYDFEISCEGLTVKVEKTLNNEIMVDVQENMAVIKFSQKIHFFRGLGLLLEALEEGEQKTVRETPQFKTSGIMPDVSQGNAVILPKTYEKMLSTMAIMGLNMLMIYMEDSYTIEKEPFFGYMRPRYSQQDFKQIDDYADIFGIEVIPAIQTLAHLKDVLKWGAYSNIAESEDILFVGEPETYKFIENMIKAASNQFRTKRIHIGMDEAWILGKGKYLDKHGIKDKHSIMNEHLAQVIKITEKYGLEAMMWSDMFFNTPDLQGYGNNYNPNVKIEQKIIDNVPKSLSLVFWEYNSDDEQFYEKVLSRHKEFNRNVLFAGGIWNWLGFGLNYGITFRTTNAALSACKKAGIDEVYATMWGDDGTENNIFSTLLGMQLYAEHTYAEELDMDKLRKRFAFCTGGNFDDFMSIKYLDEVPGVKNDNMAMCNPSKYLLWQNILLGLYDKNIEGVNLTEHYKKLKVVMEEAKKRNGKYGFMFNLLEKVCDVLEIKAEIGLNITKAYEKGDSITLKNVADSILPELAERVTRLRSYHRDLWFETNKPLGWEVIDFRYGSLLSNIDTSMVRIKDYLNGKITAIGELEEMRAPYPASGELPAIYRYSQIISASRLSQ